MRIMPYQNYLKNNLNEAGTNNVPRPPGAPIKQQCGLSLYRTTANEGRRKSGLKKRTKWQWNVMVVDRK